MSTPDRIAADALRALATSGALRTVDTAFARLLRERHAATPPVQLAGALAMRAVGLGHSGFTLANGGTLVAALEADVALPPAEAWAEALQSSPCVATRIAHAADAWLCFEHGLVALGRYARYEQQLADALRARAAVVEAIDAATVAGHVRTLFPSVGGDALDRQALAAVMALRRRLLLLTGGPGTGKTTTVARLLALQVAVAHARGAPAPRIALAAPTGRAAVRMAEAIDGVLMADVAAGRISAAVAEAVPRDASTVHRLLGAKRDGVSFHHGADAPLPHDVVLVDEASMIDLPLMAKLVAAVPPEARLVLIGDPDQLPAVEAGDVLGALCAASGDGTALPAADAAWATDALGVPVPAAQADAPLAGRRVHLVRGWRQAGAEALQAAAAAVQRGDAAALQAACEAGNDALQWRHGDVTALAGWLEQHALPHFRAVADAPDPATALRSASAMRILTALRRGPWGAAQWDAWCCARLGGRDPWFHGRLVAITANSPRHRLANGDIGVVWHDTLGNPAVWFESAGTLRAFRPGQLPLHAGAFATTVHKSQGSEFDAVALVLPEAGSRVLARELLYTALTRARRQVLLWGRAEVLASAASRASWRDAGLAARLHAVDAAD